MPATVSILGGQGMLGADLTAGLQQAGYHVRVWDLPEWDITKPEHVTQALADVAAVVNCAAFTNVDQAEDLPDVALAVNGEAVGRLGQLAKERRVYVLHISTDFVFDGANPRPYRETDRPRPINVYGATKYRGEQLLAQSGCDHAILRVEWSYGRHGTHFIAKLLDRAQTGADLKVVQDQIGAPTWTVDMAAAIHGLLRERSQGFYHFANAGYASRFEVAQFMVRELGLTNAVLPCASADFHVKAVRPKSSRFDLAKIQAVLKQPIRPWQEALAEYLRRYVRR